MMKHHRNELPPPAADSPEWPWQLVATDPITYPDVAGADLPKITVVTPSYNQADFLEATIRSVLLQGYPNLEYIIMDGGSTDGSVDIIRKYEAHLAYWISERDNGQMDVINRGFARATGEVLCWVNSDDFYEPGTLWHIGRLFLDNPETRFIYGEGWYVDEAGARTRTCPFVKAIFREVYIYNKDPTLQAATFWRRSLWEEVGPLDESLNWVFDWDWFIRAYQRTPFQYTPRFLANYRVQPQAKTRTGGVHKHREMGQITRRYGRWWYPNSLVQAGRYLDHVLHEKTARWPAFLAALPRGLTTLMRLALEWLFFGMYRN